MLDGKSENVVTAQMLGCGSDELRQQALPLAKERLAHIAKVTPDHKEGNCLCYTPRMRKYFLETEVKKISEVHSAINTEIGVYNY